ncbi:hypothetical protein ACRRTK_020734 [Alexandromys fortis]
MELLLSLATKGTVASATSVHLQWMVVQNCFSSLIKRNKQMYSTKHNNLKALNSVCYNRVIHKTVSGQQKPTASHLRTTINKNIRATLSSIRYVILEKKDHPDLYVVVIRKASANPAKPKVCGGEEKESCATKCS